MKGDACGFLHQYDQERMPVCRTLIKVRKVWRECEKECGRIMGKHEGTEETVRQGYGEGPGAHAGVPAFSHSLTDGRVQGVHLARFNSLLIHLAFCIH